MSGRQSLAGRFVLEEPAGAGGMGTIYRATDLQSGELVAVKLLAADDQLDIERFAREADVLGALSHPGIVRYISRGTSDDGQQFLVMEWIEGESLATKLNAEGLTIRESVDVARQVAGALAEAHRHGMIHRDVKPANVMLDGGALERVRVVDFGLARFVEDDHKLTNTGIAMGTPGYMSPEQVRGSRVLDGRADVFALGCVLYECLSGIAPFQGENFMALQIKVLVLEPAPLFEIRAAVPHPLSAVVQRMLAKDIDDRPAMDAVARALGTLVDLPHDERRPAGVAPPQTRRISTLVTPWLVMASPKRAGADWPTRAREAASSWQHELTRDHVLVIRRGNPQDAAHCALSLGRMLPDATLVICAPTPNEPSIEETIDRSTRVMSVAALRSIFARGAPGGRIYLDPNTAKILAEKFDVVAEQDQLILRGER